MNEKYPYAIIQRRIDIVIKVPAWAQGTINKGDQVIRLDRQTVLADGGRYKLGESYTKFKGYTEPF
jgi:hypothetical protein